MLIEVVKHQPEQEFLSWLKVATAAQRSSSVLHFRFSSLGITPQEDDILTAIVPVLEGYKGAIYMFKDGDIIIAWPGARKVIFEQVCASLCAQFTLERTPELYHYYDLIANGEQLRFLCFQKMEIGGIIAEPEPKAPADDLLTVSPVKPRALEVTSEQLDKFKRATLLRARRVRPSILIVEDQTFSRKLLHTILESAYTVFMAEDVQMGLEMHLAQAPDIIMLDIELPDFSGHELAATLRRFDPDAFIIMVTANKNMDDLKRARDNGAKAFIIKPYSKQKILDAVRLFVPKKGK